MAELAVKERMADAHARAPTIANTAHEAANVGPRWGSIGQLVLQRCGSHPCAGSCPPNEEELLMRRSASGSGLIGHGSDVARFVRPVLTSPGRPLDQPARGVMESHFNHDFGHVRVHDDAAAGLSAGAVNARSYAVGNHLAFAKGRYEPATAEGQRLIAHELTHVVQQGSSVESLPSRLRIDSTGEQNAERVAASLGVGGRLNEPETGHPQGVQRQIEFIPEGLPLEGGGMEIPFEGMEIPEMGGEPEIGFDELPPGFEEAPEMGEGVPEAGEGAPEAGDGVPEGGQELPEEGDGVPEEGDGVPEGGQETPESTPETGKGPEATPRAGPKPLPYPFPVPPVMPWPQPGEGEEEEEERDPNCGTKRLPLTVVSWQTGPLGQAGNVLASPLTKCPGNTVGSLARRRVYRDQFRCIGKAGEGRLWYPVHLLHGRTARTGDRNLHGPGDQRWNIIIGSSSINRQIYEFAEWAAVTRVHDLNQVLWYQVNVDSYFPGNEFFAKSISVHYGLYNTDVGGPVSSLGGKTFVETDTPPACPPTKPGPAGPVAAGVPAAAGAAAAAAPPTPADFTSTLGVCWALQSRYFPVEHGGLKVTLRSTWRPGPWSPPRPCPQTEYEVTLKRRRPVLWDVEIGSVKVPAGKTITLTWRHLLEDDDYYLVITAPWNQGCCLHGDISVWTFDAPRPPRRRSPMETMA